MSNRGIIILMLIAVIFTSCVSQKRLRYFQDKNPDFSNPAIDSTYEAIIQPSDILTIYVASISEETSRYFNFSPTPNTDVNSYVVDHQGNVQLPLVGDVHVAGLTTAAARDTVIQNLKKFLINPSVRLNIKNFKVTVLGDVKYPGLYPVLNEKVTLIEALALAGDLNASALRENVLVVREVNGKKQFVRVDLTARDFFSSPYYNLHTNDIVYVETSRRFQILSDNYIKFLALITGPLAAILLVIRINSIAVQ